MFEFIQKHNKLFMIMLFALVIPSFVMLGVDNYQRMNDAGHTTVAIVNGQKITQAEWDNAHRQEVDQLRASQPGIDAQLLDSPAAKYATLERMVQNRVLAEAASKLKLFISDQRLAQELISDPAIAALRGSDGKLDQTRYAQLLAAQGLTPQRYEAMVRSQLTSRQVLQGVSGAGGWMPASLADLVTRPFFERRNISVIYFKPESYKAQVHPSAHDLQAYYKSHLAEFRAPEQASIEYVVLDLASVQKHLTVSEADLQKFYEQNKDRFGTREERRASHILIAADAKASSTLREAARKKAEDILAQVQKDPASFAQLAQKYSQDPGSAKKGGDLGYFDRTTMVKPFAEAAFALKQNEISKVVETDYGYHIIKLTGIRGGSGQQSFDTLKPQIEAELKKQQAQQKFGEAVEAFKEDVFKQPQSLKAVADKFGLQIQTAQNIGRTPVPGAQGPLAQPAFLNALFTASSLSGKQNITPMEIGANQLASGRIISYSPARQKTFDEVKATIESQVTQAKAAQLAKAAGEAALKQWQPHPAQAPMPATMDVSRTQPNGTPQTVINGALRVSPSHLPALQGVDLGPQGYAVVRVNKILPADAATAAAQAQQRPQVAQAFNEASMVAYYEALKKLLKVQILVANPLGSTSRPIK